MPAISTSAEITPHIARQALHHLGQGGGYASGTYVTALFGAISAADLEQRHRLSGPYPAYVAAIQLGDLPGGIEALNAIAIDIDTGAESIDTHTAGRPETYVSQRLRVVDAIDALFEREMGTGPDSLLVHDGWRGLLLRLQDDVSQLAGLELALAAMEAQRVLLVGDWGDTCAGNGRRIARLAYEGNPGSATSAISARWTEVSYRYQRRAQCALRAAAGEIRLYNDVLRSLAGEDDNPRTMYGAPQEPPPPVIPAGLDPALIPATITATRSLDYAAELLDDYRDAFEVENEDDHGYVTTECIVPEHLIDEANQMREQMDEAGGPAALVVWADAVVLDLLGPLRATAITAAVRTAGQSS
ncbi:hypothetical protein [Cryptosporangium sp. NPDC051539]|uniref:hypothetical protein n=1 Tax=Cryptosporangium sp. NPDC051539 TaxID=3363962 RepID=UPI0037B488B1